MRHLPPLSRCCIGCCCWRFWNEGISGGGGSSSYALPPRSGTCQQHRISRFTTGAWKCYSFTINRGMAQHWQSNSFKSHHTDVTYHYSCCMFCGRCWAHWWAPKNGWIPKDALLGWGVGADSHRPKEPCIRLHIGAIQRIRLNDAALCQTTLTTCSILSFYSSTIIQNHNRLFTDLCTALKWQWPKCWMVRLLAADVWDVIKHYSKVSSIWYHMVCTS